MGPMDPGTPMPGNGGLTTVDPNQFDLNNKTQAEDFLSQMLDDSILKYDAQSFSRYFWYGVVVFMAIVAVHNLLWKGILGLKKRAASANRQTPETVVGHLVITITNLCRVLTYPQFTPTRAEFWFQVPPLGTIFLLLVYLGFILALEFIDNDVDGAQYWTSLGIRAGWLAIAQVPLLILLSGKNNLVGLIIGFSYERLNILHRWVSRMILSMAILHFAFQNYAWNKYGVRHLEWSTDSCVPTGFAALALLLWLNLSTLLPIRNFLYELFVLQHLLTFFGFIIAIMYHLPSTALETRTYIWIPIGVYLFDRLVRTVRSVWNNSSQVRATVVPVDGEVTKICVQNSRVHKWRPGSFVLLSIPHYGVIQSHPATIVSTPASHNGDLLFLLKARKGFTKSLLSTPDTSNKGQVAGSKEEQLQTPQQSRRAFIDGPYGGTQADFAAFETVLLVAGSTGITFTMSILLDLTGRLSSHKLPLRRLEVVWAVKRQLHKNWISDELDLASSGLRAAGIETKMRIFSTCDDRVTDSASISKRTDCRCDVSNENSCCCANEDHVTGPDDALQAHGMEMGMPLVSTHSGRPNMDLIFSDLLKNVHGEMGVAVCGPLGMRTAVRKTVVKSICSKQAIYLHVEGFGW